MRVLVLGCALLIFVASTRLGLAAEALAPIVSLDKAYTDDPMRLAAALKAPQGFYESVVSIGVRERLNRTVHSTLVGEKIIDPLIAHQCTGVKVAPNWILTQAACFVPRQGDRIITDDYNTYRTAIKEWTPEPDDLIVYFGSTDLSKAKSADVVEVIVGPRPPGGCAGNAPRCIGLALLRLKDPPAVRASDIASDSLTKRRTFSPSTGLLVGWGNFFAWQAQYLRGDGRVQASQQVLTVSLRDAEECSRRSAYKAGSIGADEFCAQSIYKEIDACAGFQGAPVFVAGDPDSVGGSNLSLLGLVDWGVGCGAKDMPTVYTKVATYGSWISRITGATAPATVETHLTTTTITTPAAPTATSATSPLPLIAMRPLTPFEDVRDNLPIQGRVTSTPVHCPTDGCRYIAEIAISGRPPAVGHYCAGVVVGRSWVLTAAHCLSNITDEMTKEEREKAMAGISINFGLVHGRLDEQGIPIPPTRPVDVIKHKEAMGTSDGYYISDIALIKLAMKLTPTQFAGLWTPKIPKAGHDIALMEASPQGLIVYGWGDNAYTQRPQLSTYIAQATVKYRPHAECDQRLYKDAIDELMICAGSGEADACRGDSGGPLVVYNPNATPTMNLVGLVSWGAGCGDDRLPGVYVRLAPFHSWILEHVPEW